MERNYLYGTEVSALHASSEFLIRKPIKHSNLNVSATYSASQCVEDLQRILEAAMNDKISLPATSFKHFSVVIVLPDSYIRHHVRHIMDMIFVKMGFKSAFVHVESVMSSYAMAA